MTIEQFRSLVDACPEFWRVRPGIALETNGEFSLRSTITAEVSRPISDVLKVKTSREAWELARDCIEACLRRMRSLVDSNLENLEKDNEKNV